VIFEADTIAGKAFDLALILSITLSVLAVVLDSVASVHARWGAELLVAEWAFTVLFTIEYVLRIVSVRKPMRYVFSFFGVVDLLAILPTYISLVVPGSQYLLVIRVLRVLRIFRVLKLANYLKEARQLTAAMRSSRRKITVFLFTVLTLVVILGSLMYMIEGEASGFTSIPQGVYWAIVTLTTVGYGDISPATPLGKALAAVVMILGYGIIAVPTGIVTVELSRAASGRVSTQACESCGAEGHDVDAVHCKYCGAKL
jgi:voltage-gated potassium channel